LILRDTFSYKIVVKFQCQGTENNIIEKAAQTKHKTLVLRNSTHKHTKTFPKDKTTLKKHKEEDKTMTPEKIFMLCCNHNKTF
jgi:hypothetical protein